MAGIGEAITATRGCAREPGSSAEEVRHVVKLVCEAL